MMKTKMNRDKQSIIIVIFIVIAVIVLMVCTSLVDKEETTTSTTTEIISDVTDNTDTTQVEQNDTTNETTLKVETQTQSTLVTGYNGENDTLIPATVKEVVNENVIKAVVDNKTIEVAMIGIQVSDDNKKAEFEYLNNLLKPETKIWLQYDESTMNDKGQELCYVWLSNEVDTYSYTHCKNEMVQGLLINEGLAEPLEEYPNSRYINTFNLIQGE